MLVNREARRQALEYHDAGCEHANFVDPEQLTEDEGKAYLEKIKPEQYAALAAIMDEVLDDALSVNLASYEPKVDTSFSEWYRTANPFNRVRFNVLAVFRNSIERLSDTDKFKHAAKYTKIIGSLDRRRFSDLEEQLFAGADTAATNMTSFLKELPNILMAHGVRIEELVTQLPDIAKRSVNLPWTIAMMDVAQMDAAREVSGGQISYGHGRHQDSVNHELFEVVYKNGLVFSVRYKDLAHARLYEDYDPYWTVEDKIAGISLKDVGLEGRQAVGCPITMLPGRLSQLWNWIINAAEAHGAFQKH